MYTPKGTHCKPEILLDTVSGEKGIFLKLVEVFFRESSKILLEIKFAAKSGDWVACGHHSHALKGTVGPMEAETLMQMLQQLEYECRDAKCLTGAAQIAMIEQELNQVKAEVQRFVSRM